MEEIRTQVKEVQKHCIRLIDELNVKELFQLRVQVEMFMKQLSRIEGFAEGMVWQAKNNLTIELPEEDE
jgi:hypothetical protein